MKHLIFDAGPIISLTMNSLLLILEKLKQNFDGNFIITPGVKREVVDRPLKIKKYEFESVKVQDLINREVLTLSSKFVPDNQLVKLSQKILKDANSLFNSRGEKIKLIQKGESECLAFSRLCNCENVIVIDERTTRMLTEAPENIKLLFERKLDTKIEIDYNKLKYFEGFKFIRSSELLFIAYKKNLFKLKKTKTLLDALLYGVKFKGTAISSREIQEMKRLV